MRDDGAYGSMVAGLKNTHWHATAEEANTHHLGALCELEGGEGLGEVLLGGRQGRHQKGLGIPTQRVPANSSEKM